MARAESRSVTLEFCNELRDEDVKEVITLLPKVEKVNLNGCRQLGDAGLRHVLHVADRAQVRSVSLYWCVRLTNSSALTLSKLPSLRHVNLSGVKHWTDPSVAYMCSKLPHLVELDLTRNENVREKTLQALGEHCPRLKVLRLYACSKFGDDGIEALARGCNELQVLDMTGGHNITDRAIQALAVHCPRLEWLNLTWCVQLTDDALHALGTGDGGRGLPCLEFLSLHGLKALTQSAFDVLVAGTPRMRVVDLNGCVGIQSRDVDSLRQVWPALRTSISL